jgi:hypothetical protein
MLLLFLTFAVKRKEKSFCENFKSVIMGVEGVEIELLKM